MPRAVGCDGSSTITVAVCVHGCSLKYAPTSWPYSGHSYRVSVALWAPMNPFPAETKLRIAAFCSALNGSSPVVNAKKSTSYCDRAESLMDARASVGVTLTSRADAESASIACRAVAIESWRNPAVAVSIRTRIGAPAAGAGLDGAVGACPDEHAIATVISTAM